MWRGFRWNRAGGMFDFGLIAVVLLFFFFAPPVFQETLGLAFLDLVDCAFWFRFVMAYRDII